MKRIGAVIKEREITQAEKDYWQSIRGGGSKVDTRVIDADTGEIIAEPVCSFCDDRGYVGVKLPATHPDFGKLHPCPMNCAARQQNDARRRDALQRYTMLPPEYAGLTFDSFMALEEAQRRGKMAAAWGAWLFSDNIAGNHMVDRADIAARLNKRGAEADCRNWLVLYGERGMGKTGIASATINRLREADVAALYIRLQDLLEAIQKRYGEMPAGGWKDEFGDATSDEVLDKVKRARVLILDEFDVEGISTDKRSLVENVIRHRHGYMLATIITTNLTPEQFEARWGATTASVVKQRAHWLPLTGVQLRARERSFAEWG